MSLFPVIVVFGLSFPPIFFELLLSLAIFWLVRRVLVPTGIYDFVWHPALFNISLLDRKSTRLNSSHSSPSRMPSSA